MTLAVGVLITVVLLVGFGFLATASAGWFFKYREPHEPCPHQTKRIDIARQRAGWPYLTVPSQIRWRIFAAAKALCPETHTTARNRPENHPDKPCW